MIDLAGSTFGTLFRVTTWGESHGKALGVTIDGCPAGIELCEEDIQKELDRRKPGSNPYGTKRNESDTAQILSVEEEKMESASLAEEPEWTEETEESKTAEMVTSETTTGTTITPEGKRCAELRQVRLQRNLFQDSE